MNNSKKQLNSWSIRKILIGLAIAIIIVASVLGGAISDRLFGYKILDRFFPREAGQLGPLITRQRILTEESVVIDVAEKVSPSVVTVRIAIEESLISPFGVELTPFGFTLPQNQGEPKKVEQDIGSGFIISQEGLIVTNKHVVSNLQAEYKVITNNDQAYNVQKIYRDPVNDLAILKIEAKGLTPIEMGDSDQLKVGQFVVAIGTALGEFRHTVTTGVVSGLGRGITAGSPYEGYVEQLDNVIQTDAAINPGNSGGPLLNSAGQVIGINVAVGAGENIGFAIPINVIKEAIDNFNQTGQFARPFLGVRYQMIDQDLALMNEVPQGAYVVEVVADSAAAKAGIETGDIITDFDGQPVREEEGGLAKLINSKKIGDQVNLKIWRNREESDLKVTLEESNQ
ncbi:MAG TPA: trypsin-like peptidase domain-containing protein [Patescibacteria group bacterium]|nr:trypsin-like peptidase domain-containing protein [Patescibacteria group bacterium]